MPIYPNHGRESLPPDEASYAFTINQLECEDIVFQVELLPEEAAYFDGLTLAVDSTEAETRGKIEIVNVKITEVVRAMHAAGHHEAGIFFSGVDRALRTIPTHKKGATMSFYTSKGLLQSTADSLPSGPRATGI